jgi:hypothetical protein
MSAMPRQPPSSRRSKMTRRANREHPSGTIALHSSLSVTDVGPTVATPVSRSRESHCAGCIVPAFNLQLARIVKLSNRESWFAGLPGTGSLFPRPARDNRRYAECEARQYHWRIQNEGRIEPQELAMNPRSIGTSGPNQEKPHGQHEHSTVKSHWRLSR